jgi:sugar (pentulose or hexulose) kinase
MSGGTEAAWPEADRQSAMAQPTPPRRRPQSAHIVMPCPFITLSGHHQARFLLAAPAPGGKPLSAADFMAGECGCNLPAATPVPDAPCHAAPGPRRRQIAHQDQVTVTGTAIGIDVGTSGVRAVLAGSGGLQLATASAPLAQAESRDPAAWWQAVEHALAALAASSDLSGLRAMAVDGTSGTVLMLDDTGQPIGPASLYNDPAPQEALRAVAAAAPAGSTARGAASPLAKLMAMQHAPGATCLAHQADWIAARLGARPGTSDENNALKTGYDAVLRSWPGWLRELGIRTTLLPHVVEPGTPIGTIDRALASRFGLPANVVIAAGTTDGCAAFLATGADGVGQAVTSLGSTLTLKQLSERPVFAPEYGVYSHRLGNRWLAGGASNSGGAALARHFSPAALASLSARIDPAVASGLDYYPLPGPGERFPVADPHLPPRETPRPPDDLRFLHGLLEGIARIEALGYRRLSELGGPKLVSVRTLGGGAGNAAWAAIRRQTLGVELIRARSEQAALGAAVLAVSAIR